MYGLVNRAIQSLAVEIGGPGCWEAICSHAGLSQTMFLSMESYPDEITYELIAAASWVLNKSVEETLEAFGRHWVVFTAAEGYGPILDMAGQDLETFLRNLNRMHSQIAVNMPDFLAPSFTIDDEPGGLIVHYRSSRQGLAPMVVGFLKGIVDKFSTPAIVSQTAHRDRGDDHDIFCVRLT